MVRKEVECCDNFGGFLVLQSLAGGTGSGLGTYTTELLRDEYPAGFMLNQVVWPHEHGEVTVQHFNAILTLAHLHHASDGILVFENDALTRICTQLLKLQHPSFRNMNALIAKQMTAVLLPSYRTAVRSCVSDTLAPPAQKTAEIKAAQDAHRGGGRVCRK
jgi:tubulin delta